MITTFHIHLKGRVQGVGFRPFVLRLATALGLKGWVNNGVNGLHIRFQADAATAQGLLEQILKEAPRLAIVIHHTLSICPPEVFPDFRIVDSELTGQPDLLVTPDFGLCPDCRQEIHDAADRRFGYAFTTCTLCGPRYSITSGLPYDRQRTSMQGFQQCPDCKAEFAAAENRRFFSQTNSCPNCGIQLQWWDASGKLLSSNQTDCLDQCVRTLQAGQIAAVKGIGGYLLLCDAANAPAIALLRKRKVRPNKPFALLYPNLGILREDATVSEQAAKWLLSPEAPIVLLPARENGPLHIAMEAIAPGLQQIGAMLPYAPLLELLAAQFGRPLVATSGNVSGSPIVYEDQTAVARLGFIADRVLSHNRPILAPQDDSVLRLAGEMPVWIRRSRGIAPSLLVPGWQPPEMPIFCAGADMKSAFCLNTGGQTYHSQYLGNLDHFDTQQQYLRLVRYFENIFQEQPALVVADAHPGYVATNIAGQLAAEWKAPLTHIQHHEAHFAAVLAENQLLASDGILGIIWDGTGYGHDGQIWGGEFFRWDNHTIYSCGQMSYFPVLAGDKMAREPRLSAFSLANGHPDLDTNFEDKALQIYRKMLEQPAHLSTSSMGRIFDAVAALLGYCHINTFEGEAAMRLEQAALGAKSCGWYDIPVEKGQPVSSQLLAHEVLQDLAAGTSTAVIAFRFHRSLVEIIRKMALQETVEKIAFSGGVFQNALLVQLCKQHLSSDFELFFHRQLPPNDECIAFGQMVLAGLALRKVRSRAPEVGSRYLVPGKFMNTGYQVPGTRHQT